MGLPNWRRWPGVAGRVMPRSFGEAQHLRADTDAAFIQRFDRDLVALATLSKQVLFRNQAILKNQLAGAGRANT